MLAVAAGDAGHLFAMCAGDADGVRLCLPRSVYSRLQMQMALSAVFAVYASPAASVPSVLAGLVELPTGEAEAWFLVRGVLAPATLLAFVRVAREVLGLAGQPVICCVMPGHRSGERLARLLGFVASGDAIGEFAVWRRAA